MQLEGPGILHISKSAICRLKPFFDVNNRSIWNHCQFNLIFLLKNTLIKINKTSLQLSSTEYFLFVTHYILHSYLPHI